VTDRISDVENVSASVTRCFVGDVEEKKNGRFEFLLINNAKELYATLSLSSRIAGRIKKAERDG
jgi:hypothetical protein